MERLTIWIAVISFAGMFSDFAAADLIFKLSDASSGNKRNCSSFFMPQAFSDIILYQRS
jgi:hypothetical protein